MFIIENNKSSGKKEIEHVIEQIYKPKLLENKKAFRKFIIYVNENKVSFTEEISKKIKDIIKEVSDKNIIMYDYTSKKQDIDLISESVNSKDNEKLKELWYKYVDTTK